MTALGALLVVLGVVLTAVVVMGWALLAATGAAEREWERTVKGKDEDEP